MIQQPVLPEPWFDIEYVIIPVSFPIFLPAPFPMPVSFTIPLVIPFIVPPGMSLKQALDTSAKPEPEPEPEPAEATSFAPPTPPAPATAPAAAATPTAATAAPPAPAAAPTAAAAPAAAASSKAPNFPIKIVKVDKLNEVVQLQNVGSEPVDLTGWRMVSVTGNQTHPGVEGVIQPGESRFFPNMSDKAIWNDKQRDDGALYDKEETCISYWDDVGAA